MRSDHVGIELSCTAQRLLGGDKERVAPIASEQVFQFVVLDVSVKVAQVQVAHIVNGWVENELQCVGGNTRCWLVNGQHLVDDEQRLWVSSRRLQIFTGIQNEGIVDVVELGVSLRLTIRVERTESANGQVNGGVLAIGRGSGSRELVSFD